MDPLDQLAVRFDAGLTIVMNAMKDEFIQQGHSASGKTLDSFEVVIRREFQDLVGEILVASTAVFVDNRTRAHRPPFKAIFEWSEHVLKGASEEERKSFSWAVINKIEKEGTPTRKAFEFSKNGRRTEFSRIAIDATEDEFEGELDYLLFILDLGDDALRAA